MYMLKKRKKIVLAKHLRMGMNTFLNDQDENLNQE